MRLESFHPIMEIPFYWMPYKSISLLWELDTMETSGYTSSIWVYWDFGVNFTRLDTIIFFPKQPRSLSLDGTKMHSE
jgi:hypothetical protein